MSKSILERDKRCFFCDTIYNLEQHHVFGGPNRRNSEHYGLKVHLCPMDHRDNKEGVHGNAEKNMVLKMYAQRIFEEKHSREEFVRVFGKNYLEPEGETECR